MSNTASQGDGGQGNIKEPLIRIQPLP